MSGTTSNPGTRRKAGKAAVGLYPQAAVPRADPATPVGDTGRRDLVVASSPFGQPQAHVVAAAERAGALGILDLGRDAAAAGAALADARRWCPGGFGVRVGAGVGLGPQALPEQ